MRSGAEFEVRNAELEFRTRSAECGVRGGGVRNSELELGSSELECGTPQSALRTPHSEFRTRVPTPNSEFRTPNHSAFRTPHSAMKCASCRRCVPAASKLSGESHRSQAARSAGHSRSMIEYHAVSRF